MEINSNTQKKINSKHNKRIRYKRKSQAHLKANKKERMLPCQVKFRVSRW